MKENDKDMYDEYEDKYSYQAEEIKDVLSEEEQADFSRVMDEYESMNGRAMNEANAEGSAIRTLKQRSVLLGIIAVLCVGSVIGLANAFMDVSKNNAEDVNKGKEQPAVEQQTVTANTNEQQQQEQEEAQARQKDKEELDSLKNGFHPFDDSSTTGNTSSVNYGSSVVNATDTSNGSYFDSSYNQNSQPTYSYAQNTAPSSNYDNPDYSSAGYNGTYNGTYDGQTVNASDGRGDTSSTGAWMELKGIASDRDGNPVCYIQNGETTKTYRVGSQVDSQYHVAAINGGKVTLADDNGYTMTISK